MSATVDMHRARERVLRVLYMSTGFGAIVFGLILGTKISSQAKELNSVFAATALLVAIVVPSCLVVLAWTLPLRALHWIAATTAAAFVLHQLLWESAMTVPFLAGGSAPWMWGVNAVPAVLVTVLVRRWYAVAYAVLQAVVVSVVGFASTNTSFITNLRDGVGALVFCTILIGTSLALIEAADRQDVVAARARAQAALEAARRTREREQGRIDAIVHDDIMSVLLVASREAPSRRLSERAEGALASIATLSVDSGEAPDYSRTDAIAALRTAVTDTASQVEFWHSSDGDAPIPASVIEAMTEAISEAVRNSMLHAGGPDDYVQRVVRVDLTDGAVRATISDTGRGFNPRAVNDRRLGIRVSILERMRLLEGGSADVDSRPGRGTTVTLTWVRQR